MGPLTIAVTLPLAVCLILASSLISCLGNWRLQYPRLALGASHLALVIGVIALITSIVTATCSILLGAARPWGEELLTLFTSWLGIAILGVFASVVVAKCTDAADSHFRARCYVSITSNTENTTPVGGINIVVLDSELPEAFSLPGKPHFIVVTSKLREELNLPELHAVIEHEMAHLNQRHGRIRQWYELHSLCLLGLPLPRRLEASVHLLLELIADDTAARKAGAVNTANALAKVGTLRKDKSMLVRAHRLAVQPPRGSIGAKWRANHPYFRGAEIPDGSSIICTRWIA